MVTWSAVRGSGITGRQGGVSPFREVSPLEVVARGMSPRAPSDEWKNRLRRLDTADILGLVQQSKILLQHC